MADFTKSLANTVQLFGAADTENWNEIVWATDNWGHDDDLEFEVGKAITNTVTGTISHTFHAERTISTNTVTALGTNVTITQQDSNGYFFVFTSDTINAGLISSSVFTNVTNNSHGFTTVTVGSTTWEDA